jgi:phospholipid/cholesterol/gamma-HCH transport system ATP-binding protein
METSILAFQDVAWLAGDELALRPFRFSLGQGEAAWIAMRPGEQPVPWGDLAQGLVEPSEGAVQFQGKDWRQYAPHEGAAARGAIRRVFASGGWLSNLDVDENVTLSERHHTVRPAADIEAEVDRRARQFGLDGVPRMRPALVKPGELRRAEWVRAFMGTPALIILEEPMRDVYTDHLPALLRAVREARAGGTAILWLTAAATAPVEDLDPIGRWIVEDGVARNAQEIVS